jgi:hypothetical protein
MLLEKKIPSGCRKQDLADAESLAAAYLSKENNNTMQLWAKSLHAQVTLADHAADCASAALSLFSPEHNHGRSWSSFFQMTEAILHITRNCSPSRAGCMISARQTLTFKRL